MNNSVNDKRAAAAVLAIKAHVIASTPEILGEIDEGPRIMQKIAQSVDLTEAPEDAVCSLVLELMHYCDREKIHWNAEVVSRAWENFRSERTDEVRKR